MNFFTIGFIFCSLNFNIGHPINYITRLIGVFFMLGGIKETLVSEDSFGFESFRTDVLITLVCALLGTAASLLMGFELIPQKVGFLLTTTLGVLTFLSVISHQFRIIRKMRPMKALVNDPSLLERLWKAWRNYAAAASVTMFCQLVMRLSTSGKALHTAAGALFFITIIIQYVLLVHMGGAFNDVRTDYNVMHPIEPFEQKKK